MLDTCAVNLSSGYSYPQRKASNSALHPHGFSRTSTSSQLLPPPAPSVSNNPSADTKKLSIHPQLQEPYPFTNNFRNHKDGGFELAVGSGAVELFDYHQRFSEGIKMPINTWKANEVPTISFKEINMPMSVSNVDTSSWKSIILANSRTRQYKQVIGLYLKMQSINVEPDSFVLVAVLEACSHLANLGYGHQVHAHTIESGLEPDGYIGDALIDMYATCGTLEIAHVLFERLPTQDAVTWSRLIAANIQHGREEGALSLFHCRAQTEEEMSLDLYSLAIKACTIISALEEGKQIHMAIIKDGLESELSLANNLINMYARSQNLEIAATTLLRLPGRHVISWNAVIGGYIHGGYGDEAIQMFDLMMLDGLEPDAASYITILKACSKVNNVKQGTQYHILIVKVGFDVDCLVCSTLVDMYVKCGSLEDGLKVFNSMPKHDSIVWGALLAGYVQHGKFQGALQLFGQMQEEGVQPSAFTIQGLLKVCASIGAIIQGQKLHLLVVEHRYESDPYVGNILVDMYTKLGSLKDAQRVFDQLPKRDVVAWSSLMLGYVLHEKSDSVFQLFVRMQQENVEPNHVTFCCLLKACASIGSLEKGNFIHSFIIKEGLEKVISVTNSLLDMYRECGSWSDACTLFLRMPEPDGVSWSILIGAYNKHGLIEEALQAFEEMKQLKVELDEATFVCILQTCSKGASKEKIKEVHNLILENGCEANSRVGNTLIDMYAKLENFEDAWSVFDRLPERDAITWNVLIGGYAQHGYHQQAVSLFKKMQQEGVDPDEATYVCLFKVCASTAAFNEGKVLHEQFLQKGFVLDEVTGCALIDMYVSCGSLRSAEAVFYSLPREHIAPWNALLAGYAQHNKYDFATQCFQDLCHTGLLPNSVTYMCILSACSHAGFVDQGIVHFKAMRESGFLVSAEHLNLMVGLFCRANSINEAEDLLETLHFPYNVVGWTSLLAACRKEGNVKSAERCFRHVTALGNVDKTGTGAHLLMSCVYRKAGMWEEAERIEELRKSASVWKKPAKSYIEVGDKVHEFTVGDDKHPYIDEIHTKLKTLSMHMKGEGCFSHTEPAVGHSEKLALAFGLISSPAGATIRILKNLRVCEDCHNAAKLVSRIEHREIFIRDSYCVHQFKDGWCSCKDLC